MNIERISNGNYILTGNNTANGRDWIVLQAIEHMNSFKDTVQDAGLINQFYHYFTDDNLLFKFTRTKKGEEGIVFYISPNSFFIRNKLIRKEKLKYKIGQLTCNLLNLYKSGYRIENDKLVFPDLIDLFDSFPTLDEGFNGITESLLIDLFRLFKNFGFDDVISVLFIRDFIARYIETFLNYPIEETHISNFLKISIINNHIIRQILDNNYKVISEPAYLICKSGFIRNEKDKFVQLYEASSTDTIISIDMIHLRNSEATLKTCEACGNHYIQYNKYHTKRCEKCRNIGYGRRIPDEYANAYYKFKNRNSKLKERCIGNDEELWNSNERDYYYNIYEPIIEKAKSKLEEFREKKDIDGFISFLDKLTTEHKNNRPERRTTP